jgi:DNA polymerase-4
LGKAGAHLWQLSHGMDDRPVAPEEGFKSIGHENTFEQDTADFELINKTVLDLTHRVAHRLRGKCARARTISVKYREADFSTYTRRTTLSDPVDTSEKIFPVAVKLLKTLLRENVLVRLVGVYASNLEITSSGKQMALFDESQKDRKLAAAIDDIAQRFGDNAITRAALVKKVVSGESLVQGHSSEPNDKVPKKQNLLTDD